MKKVLSKQEKLAIFIVINTIIFLLLSLLHFYWAFGGERWFLDVLPTDSSGSMRLNPGMMPGLIVASGLLFLALITIGNQGLFVRYIQKKYFRYGAMVIAVIFFVRAIGDFKFVGFFKTITNTRFAINDTQFFSPSCLFIAMMSLIIFILTGRKSIDKKAAADI